MFDKIMFGIQYTIYVGVALVAAVLFVAMVVSIIDANYLYAAGCWIEGLLCSVILICMEDPRFLDFDEEDEEE